MSLDVTLGKFQDPTQSMENKLKIKLAKLPVSLKNSCGIRPIMLYNLYRDSYDSLFTLTPECQIKILEENLNLLQKKGSREKHFKIKSDICRIKSSEAVVHVNMAPSLLLKNELNLPLGLITTNSDDKSLNEVHYRTHVGDMVHLNYTEIETSLSDRNRQSENHQLSSFPELRSNDKGKYCRESPNGILEDNPNISFGAAIASTVLESDIVCRETKKNDIDSQFEFTIEQENILSFVFGHNPTGKKLSESFAGVKDCNSSYVDRDSDKHSEFSCTIEDTSSPPETISNLSGKSSNDSDDGRVKNVTEIKFIHPSHVKPNDYDKLLWHPPSSPTHTYFSSANRLSGYRSTTPTSSVKINPVQTNLGHQRSLNNNNKDMLSRSLNQESILFREASLRGCYNIENILEMKKPTSNHIVEEVKNVKEAIFSSVRTQKVSDNVVSDSLLAILGIFRSWMTLNSYFDQKELKTVLEMHGVDKTLLCDFLQWQCKSRTFIDKMIYVLSVVTFGNDICCCNEELPSLVGNIGTRGSTHTCDINKHQNLFNSYMLGSVRRPQSQATHKFEEGHNRHWKQRRFLADQQRLCAADIKKKKLNKSKFTISSGATGLRFPIFNNTEAHCQGDAVPVSYKRDVSYGSLKDITPDKCNQIQVESNLFSLGVNSHSDQDVKSGCPTHKVPFFSGSAVSNLTDFGRIRSETNVVQASPVNSFGLSSQSVSGVPVNNDYTLNIQTMTSVQPPIHNSLFCIMHPQANSRITNPIQCTDTEVSENCIKSNYIKPGSYNPPQKPVNMLKSVNNTIPIEETPLVGVRFLYSNPNDTQQSLTPSKNTAKMYSVLENGAKNADESWKSALTLAESLKDNMMSNKVDEGPNLKLSDLVSLKTHFLLSDNESRNSNGTKQNSEADELTKIDNVSQGSDISVVEGNLKTTDWLLKTFNGAVVESEKEGFCKDDPREFICDGIGFSGVDLREFQEQKQDKQHNFGYPSTNHPNNESKSNHSLTNNVSIGSGTSLSQKKGKKNKMRDEYMTPFQQKHSMLLRKSKSIFKRSITKQVSYKLEDILDSICNAKVTHLDLENFKSDQDLSRLEMKVRSPLHLQTMKCKLSNQSYDTLEQALTDFQQYFTDIKSRNKGDKQCVEIVDALEQIFVNMVDKHFGSSQPSPQCFNPVVGSSSFKTRKSKKSSR